MGASHSHDLDPLFERIIEDLPRHTEEDLNTIRESKDAPQSILLSWAQTKQSQVVELNVDALDSIFKAYDSNSDGYLYREDVFTLVSSYIAAARDWLPSLVHEIVRSVILEFDEIVAKSRRGAKVAQAAADKMTESFEKSTKKEVQAVLLFDITACIESVAKHVKARPPRE
eukprot:JP447440.1.p1 GENE.JP447440.1~~JP447440.1.p1  ORF type:complete len:171 (-),score=17.78 JP447440.1:52-564(-)